MTIYLEFSGLARLQQYDVARPYLAKKLKQIVAGEVYLRSLNFALVRVRSGER